MNCEFAMPTLDRYRRPRICPDCFAPFRPELDRCWLCGWKVGDPIRQGPHQRRSFDDPRDYSRAPVHTSLKWTFSLSTMFLWTTMVAALAAVTRMVPGLGIALIVLSLPAALRTIVAVGHRSERTGKQLTASEKISIFANSLVIAVGAGVAAIAAFLAVCTVTTIGASPLLSWSRGWVAVFIVMATSLGGAGYAAYVVMRARSIDKD
jgi:hypothetical protein